MKWRCEDCGDETDAQCAEPWDCVRCGGDMVPANQSETVPKEDLEALVEEWREMADKAGPEEFVVAYTRAADELAEVLEE